MIELMVTLAIIALLLTLVTPRYLDQADRAREAALKQNLAMLRHTIDRYHADKGQYPTSLQDLVSARYLRSIPSDPMTDRSDSWRLLPANDTPGIFDVKSGSPALAQDGSRYADW